MRFSFATTALVILIALPLYADTYDQLVAELSAPVASSDDTVAVAEFESDRGSRSVDFIAAEITEAFVRADIAVVERTNIDRISEEQQFQLSGAVEDDTVSEIGRALGADYLVFGTIRRITRPGYSNQGLRIQAQLIEVETAKVVSSASIEVEESDMNSPYKRREVRGPAEYPAMMNLKAGGALYSMDYRDADSSSSVEADGRGLRLGVDFLKENKGFFTQGWEFLYGWENQDVDDDDLTVHRFSLGKLFMARIPVWRYLESLPFLTHAFLGLAASGDLSFSSNDTEAYGGFGFRGEGIAGWSMGISDGISLMAEYRYTPRFLTIGFSGFGSEDLGSMHSYRLTGHQLMVGITFQP